MTYGLGRHRRLPVREALGLLRFPLLLPMPIEFIPFSFMAEVMLPFYRHCGGKSTVRPPLITALLWQLVHWMTARTHRAWEALDFTTIPVTATNFETAAWANWRSGMGGMPQKSCTWILPCLLAKVILVREVAKDWVGARTSLRCSANSHTPLYMSGKARVWLCCNALNN